MSENDSIFQPPESESSDKPNDADLKALQDSANKNRELYKYEKPNPAYLEWFPTPEGVGELAIVINIPEFTSLCPKTGQPDSGDIVIKYYPDKRCIESKSLKLYIMGFRMFGEFHESCCRRIMNDLVELLDPLDMTVSGKFFWRGGINFNPCVRYARPDDGAVLPLYQR